MKQQIFFFLPLLALLSLSVPAVATVIYVSGDQTGIWSADTVMVIAEVRVPPEQNLTIMPGVEVLFQVYCKLIVDSGATLRAVGTAADSIRFDALQESSYWYGIRLLVASDSCRLQYCHLANGYASGAGEEGCGGAIYCSSSNPAIWNSLIENCSAANAGGGIHCWNSNPDIRDNIISSNYAADDGGGICCYINSNANITGNIVSGNSTGDDGGGIYCWSSSPTISGNIISENGALYLGGGIFCYQSSAVIDDNIIRANSADMGGGIIMTVSSSSIIGNIINANSASGEFGWGGGIYCNSAPVLFQLNEISENNAVGFGGGIYSVPAISGIDKCTFVANSAYVGGGIYCVELGPTTLVNSILWENNPQPIYGNAQISYSDIMGGWIGEGNIDADPLFMNSALGDYHLQLNSPCIDAGDPDPFYNDPDSTRADMGCYPYDSAYVAVRTTPLQMHAEEYALSSCFPNPFNPSTCASYELRVASHVQLRVYDTAGRLVTTLVDGWKPAGTHQAMFDGSTLPSGIYLARLTAGDFQQTQKLVLLK